MISSDSEEKLASLGQRLREARLAANEKQARFAARLGISVPTLRKLENGDPAVGIGVLVEALAILGRQDELDALLAPKDDLFARWEAARNPQRKRAGRDRKP
jgi:transcriptional regulator with XRE-family HTH domain